MVGKVEWEIEGEAEGLLKTLVGDIAEDVPSKNQSTARDRGRVKSQQP